MFDFDAGKLLIIGIVALVFIPSKDLPRVLRQLGQFVSKMRRMASEFQGQFMEAMREADMAELRKEAEKLTKAAEVSLSFDPINDIKTHVSAALEAKPALAASEAAALGAASEASALGVSQEALPGAPQGSAPGASQDMSVHGERSIAPPELATHSAIEGDLVSASGASQITGHGDDAERLTPLELAREEDRAEALDSVSRSA